MAGPKRDRKRAYAPDYVSAESLAYRLDCSRSTIDEYVRLGVLPKPQMIGSLARWDFEEVRGLISAMNNRQSGDDHNRVGEHDVYLEGLKRGTQA